MFEPVKIAPSILSADFMHLGRDIELIEKAGAGYVHVDVMDGHFVPNLTMGVPVVKQLKKATSLPLDVHLMIANPLEQLPWFLDAGADSVTVHAEALDADGLARAVAAIHAAGAKAAVSVKPRTAVGALAPVLADLDMVLVMSVEPGFSGQSYIEGSEAKVARIAEMARAVGASPLIQVDGGIGEVTAPIVAAAGADVLVCGNAVFAAEDPAAALAAVMLLAQPLEELKGFWEEAASWGQLPVQLFVPLVKTVGIALLCRTGSDLCRDAGESAIGSVLETAGAVAAIVVSLPLFRSAWELLRSLV